MTQNNHHSTLNNRALIIALSLITLVVIVFFVGRSSVSLPKLQSAAPVEAAKANQRTISSQESVLIPHEAGSSQEVGPTKSGSAEDDKPINQLFRALGGPPLTREQIRYIQKQYDLMVQRREQVELKLAQAELYVNGQMLITIPAYPEEGRELYNQFVSSLRDQLGQNTTSQALASIGKTIESLNRDFGAHEQNILIEDTGAQYKVIHGSEKTVNITDHSVSISGATTGTLSYDNPSSYAYLKQFFPKLRH